ncbi:sulfate/molybdate ABC transporter ATP-binding protein [Aeromonas hydrophila]
MRKELRRWLRELHDELHVTSLFVTHDQEEALEVADRVVLMNAGKVEQIGTPAEVYDQPASSFVHSFLGSVNLFRGRVAGQGLGIGEQLLGGPISSQLAEGSAAVAYVRPHELEILPADAPGGISATITRLLPMGPRIRVELRGNGDTNGAHFEAELSKEAARAFSPGQGVRLVAKQAQLYPDYQI